MPPSRPQQRPRPGHGDHADNDRLLRLYRQAQDRALRNALVVSNLPLVRRVAARVGHGTTLPYDDLVQIGCLGLIRAIETFDPERDAALSSYAVPYIRGAMLHHLRDQHPPLRCSRRLRELHHRGQTLLQQHQHRRLPPLSEAELAAALGCRPEQWREACALHRALRLRSLDAPVSDENDGELRLLDTIPDPSAPHPFRPDHRPESFCCEPEPQGRLRLRLNRLDPQRRALLLGRVLSGTSWRELGVRLGLGAEAARRRFEAVAQELRRELGEGRTA